MGLLNGLGNAAKRAQLNGEILLIDRELVARKKSFGVEMFDAISKQPKGQSFAAKRNTNGQGMPWKIPRVLKEIQEEIQEPLESCYKDVMHLELEISNKEDTAYMIDAKRDVDVNRTMGKRVSDTAREAQLATQITMHKRNIKLRKEQLGMEIWDAVGSGAVTSSSGDSASGHAPKRKSGFQAMKGAVKNVKGQVSKTLGGNAADYEEYEKGVDTCVDKAKREIQFMEDKKRRRQQEIQELK